MKKIVVKFGGSNLKTKEDINKLLKVIGLYNRPIIIVISALFGVTNKLIGGLEKIRENENAIMELIDWLRESHYSIIDLHIDQPQAADRIKEEIKGHLLTLEKYLLGMHYLNEIPDFAYDLTLSYGEKLSAITLNAILSSKRLESKCVMPEEIGLITDGEFHNATVNFKKCAAHVAGHFNQDKIYIVPGFYGISESNKITLLGRGGSDYSAASIARCVRAEYLDIWKDVAGYMSADPKLISDAVPLRQLTYKEAAELSYFGAKILHPRTFEPLHEDGIQIRLFNIDEVGDTLDPISIINDHPEITESVVKSVTSNDSIAILKMRGSGVGVKPGIIAKTATALNNAKINIKSIITAQTNINLLFDIEDIDKAADVVRELNLSYVDDIVVIKDMSLIAVVGEGMLHQPGIAARVFSAVYEQKINVNIISAGASSVATYFIVKKDDCSDAVKAIHREFFK
ncbi:MAG: aspartate kinase [Acidobacteria bacterium]|nr:aspartate kinase [Acidobacteriota bacterium]